MLWLVASLFVLCVVSGSDAAPIDLIKVPPAGRQETSGLPALLQAPHLFLPSGPYAREVGRIDGFRILDSLRLEVPGIIQIGPPEARSSSGSFLRHFPRIGFYALLDTELALYITEPYDARQYEGKLVARKDMLIMSDVAELALTVIDDDPWHRRHENRFETGIFARLPTEFAVGGWKLRGEFSVGYDERSGFLGQFRIHLGE